MQYNQLKNTMNKMKTKKGFKKVVIKEKGKSVRVTFDGTQIVLESEEVPSFTGFWTKWIAKKGKHTVEARTAHKALTEILKIK